ncbi:B12-binding domain-containing radical SAM protein [Candidatus Nitrosarchaeum limnium]|uniref:Radical SAM domain protein n=1 Tax=Candidatus Nitrosarchaeum limnium BG20 TaxID=859192 RepID=S2EKZ5_9ARCH|nr:radical SAM protein [Candidatus Nitrosarchaeum limnium]EPA05307.1 radical SAM domain protein [Candidatus Nitrosarchaeum limnium BG20]
MKVLFVVPEIRLDGKPYSNPLWAGILASIVEKKNGHVGILDLNALRMNYGGGYVPSKVIEEEISSEKWDLIGIGGLTSTYSRMKQIIPMIRKHAKDSIIIAGGGWITYNPDEIMQLIPEIDLACIGEGEITFEEVYDQIEKGSKDFDSVGGLCIRKNNEFFFTKPRALISNLDDVPYPSYDLYELDIYFRYSSMPYSVDAINSKRRLTVVWERGCPRGCTFCSHNGMSRIDMQNILGRGDRKAGELLVREIDKDNDTFQLPARWPTPRYAVDNVSLLYEKYNIDFLTISDENMTSNAKWTNEFCKLYVEEGLDKKVKWGTLGDAPSVATKPELIKVMKDAGCSYISFGFESASDKVLSQDIQKGQTQEHLQKTINAIQNSGLQPIATFMIGNPHEDINDLMETVTFWMKNGIVVNPFICTPYVGSPLFYNNKDKILEQYDEKIKILNQNKSKNQNYLKKLNLQALDAFMSECGDATDYTATVSQYFTIPELYALKQFMYKHDVVRMLQMAHQRYQQTGENQWKHDEKWSKYCQICKSEQEIYQKIETKQ